MMSVTKNVTGESLEFQQQLYIIINYIIYYYQNKMNVSLLFFAWPPYAKLQLFLFNFFFAWIMIIYAGKADLSKALGLLESKMKIRGNHTGSIGGKIPYINNNRIIVCLTM